MDVGELIMARLVVFSPLQTRLLRELFEPGNTVRGMAAPEDSIGGRVLLLTLPKKVAA